MRHNSAIIILLLLSLSAFSQQTVIKGVVTDAQSGEGIPFANVVFKNSTVGTTTDFDGFFQISTQKPTDSLTVTFIGYQKKTKYVQKGKSQQINFQLKPTAFEIEEITVLPGENPAIPFMESVWENLKKNDKRSIPSYDYESYVKIEVGVDNISENFRNKKIMKPFAYLFDSLQIAAGEDGQPVLPIFVSETLSDIYKTHSPDRNKEVIKANKITGVGLDDGSFVSQFVGASFQEYNFYKGWLNILDKNFVSPLNNSGFSFYRYYIMDSAIIEGDYCYKLQFIPKRDEDLAFNGEMWITTDSYALKRISAEIGKSANLNFVERLKIQQDLSPTEAGPWLPSKTRVLIDVAEFTDESFGMLGKFYVSNKDFKVNTEHKPSFYKSKIEVMQDSRDYDEEFWEEKRHKELDETEKNIYKIVDSISNFPAVKTYVDVAEAIVEGYVDVGKIDIGPYLLFYGYNVVEGHRFRAGFKTNADFSKEYIFRGYLAYGTMDRTFKYNLQAEKFLNKRKWTKIGIQHKYDLEGLGVYDDFFYSNTLFAASSQIGLVDRFNMVNLTRIWFETDLFKDFTQRVYWLHKAYNPKGNYIFSYYQTPQVEDSKESEFKVTELSFESRYAPHETVLINDNDRVRILSEKAPAITMRYTLGFQGLIDSDFDYHRISLNLEQRLKLGAIGRGEYSLTGTKIFGQLPYPLLNILPGNETFIRSENTYDLMNFFEFVADQTVELRYTQHFDGFLLNRIPLMRKLKWRMLAGTKMAYGSFNSTNYNIIPETDSDGNEVTDDFKTLNSGVPYVEVHYGIENIFRFVRVDFIHRLTYLDNPNVPRWGIKGSLYFSF